MKFQFNKGTTKEQKDKIKRIVNAVKTCSAKDMLIRVVFLKTDYCPRKYHGYYKNINDHGFYDSEWERVYDKKNCKHIIQLFIKLNESEESISRLIAHEWRHYIQFTKKREKYVEKNGHLEVDARNWSSKRVNELIASKIIKPEYHFGLMYWRCSQFFEEVLK